MQVSDDIRHQIVALLPRLRRFAYALTGDSDRGDDLVQDVCIRALSKQEQWQVGTRLDSWLYRIAQNLWFDRIRAGKVRGDNVDIVSVDNLPGDDGRSIVEDRSTLTVVSRAIDRLPPDQKVLIALVCVDGLTYKEAADVLEIPIGTVMSRLARARRTLHEATRSEPARDNSAEVGTRRG